MAQDTHAAAKSRFKELQDAFEESRARMVDDLKFSNPADPQQWDEGVRRAREQSTDGARPCLTFDQTNQYIAQVVNDARQNKPSIKVLPVDSGADVEVANRIEGMIRHIEYSSRAGIAYDTAIEHAARIGLGWLRVVPEVVNAERNEQEIRIKRLNDPLSALLDNNSVEPDGSDAVDGFVTSLVSKAQFKRDHPKARIDSWEQSGPDGWFQEDAVRICEYFKKVETKSSRLSIAGPNGNMEVTEEEYWEIVDTQDFKPQVMSQYYVTETKVKWLKMSGCEILEETDFPSKYIPLVPVIGYELWIEGKRYLCGMVRRMMDSQRAYNYERTGYVEMVALQPKAPYLVPSESIEGYEDEWSSLNTGNRPYVPYNALDGDGNALPPPKREAPPQIATAMVQGGALALNDIQASIGMYRSNLGAPSNATSGRAKMADQREGDTANFHYTDNLSRGIEQLGRIVVDMIPRIYDTQRIARIVGDDGTNDFVTIDPEQQEAITKEKDPNTGKPKVTINLDVGTYDVRVKAGPSYSTMRQESAEAIGNVLQGNPQAFAVLGGEWARMQDWPNAEKVSKLLMAMAPPQVQALEEGADDIPPQVQAQMAQMKQMLEQTQQQLQQAQQQLEGDAVKAMADIQKSDKDRQVDMYKAKTERMKAMAPAFDPMQIQVLVAQTLQQMLSGGLPQGAQPMQSAPPPPMQQMPPGPPPEMAPQESMQPPPGGFSLPAPDPLGGVSP